MARNRKTPLATACVLACVSAFASPAVAVDALRLQLDVGSKVVSVGGTVTVFLRATDLASAINGVQVRLSYDTSLLSLDSIVANDLESAGLLFPPAAGWMEVYSTDTNGDVDWAAVITDGGVLVDHLIARLTFTALVEGSTRISFRSDSPPFLTKLTRATDNAVVLPNTVDSNNVVLGLPAVDLVWSPSFQVVQTGQTVRFDLVAVSATDVDPSVASIDVVLNWNPLLLELIGIVDTGPFPWSGSGFPDDSGLDGLNAPFDGETPLNDGNAFYQALADFAFGAPVTASGLVVTSFDFLALDGTAGTPLVIVPSGGTFTASRVLGAGPFAAVDITGTLGSATTQITECAIDNDCTDGNVCTDDVCNAGVCEHSDNTLSCDDGLFCTAGDVCSGGSCVGGIDPCTAPDLCSEPLDACVECLTNANCTDGDVCTDDVCGTFGTCEFPDNTAPCDDGLFCTSTDTCSAGVCLGAGDRCPGELCDEPGEQCVECLFDGDCDDSNICTDDLCIANVCDNPSNTDPCNDGLFCTAIDICIGGFCTGSVDPCLSPSLCSEQFDACVQCLEDPDCDEGNICTTDTCAFGVCSQFNNTLPCDDDLFCTVTDACSGGSCVGTGDSCPGELCDEPNSQCLECFTLADCPDDGFPCTEDACVDGECVYPTNDSLCDDGAFCNGAETCSVTLGCRAAESPCDDPALCNEANESCGCREPVVEGEGSRYFSITPQPGVTEVAFLVTGLDPDVSCISKFVQHDGSLGDTPWFRLPGGASGWHTVHVFGLDVVPSSNYRIEAVCETGAGLAQSTPATATTWRWADMDQSGGLIDIVDILLVVEVFQGIHDNVSIYAADMWGLPGDCLPQQDVDIQDISRTVEAFQGIPFPCSSPCASVR